MRDLVGDHAAGVPGPGPRRAGVARPRAVLHAAEVDGLEGRYRVERTGGLLPPMLGVTKRVDGAAGSTRVLEAVGWPFRLERGGEGLRLVYRAPLGFLVDELRPGDGGVWLGRATAAGRQYGTFRLVPVSSG